MTSDSNINPSFNYSNAKKEDVNVLIKQLLGGDRLALSKAITIIESTLDSDRELANIILKECLLQSSKSIRIGITGVPGVGKSTFIEAFGLHLTEQNHQVAVLTIDPTSQQSKGSILADKTRMEKLSVHSNAYIRPTASGNAHGGVANGTRESIILCEAAGFEIILVETVGVGQAEFIVHSMVDFFLLLALSGAGDELQGIKRGIMEMVDSIVITKSDGNNVARANEAKSMYQSALHLLQSKTNSWSPQVLTCSALHNEGINEIWGTIQTFLDTTTSNGYFEKNRNQQLVNWLEQNIELEILKKYHSNTKFQEGMRVLKEKVQNKEIDVQSATDIILGKLFKN